MFLSDAESLKQPSRAAQREARKPENSFWIIRQPKITTWLSTDWRPSSSHPSNEFIFSVVFDHDSGHDEVNGSEWSL
jgi:hypothetical protein